PFSPPQRFPDLPQPGPGARTGIQRSNNQRGVSVGYGQLDRSQPKLYRPTGNPGPGSSGLPGHFLQPPGSVPQLRPNQGILIRPWEDEDEGRISSGDKKTPLVGGNARGGIPFREKIQPSRLRGASHQYSSSLKKKSSWVG